MRVTRVPGGGADDYLIQYVAYDDSLGSTLLVDQRIYPTDDNFLLAAYVVTTPDSIKADLGPYRRATEALMERIERSCELEPGDDKRPAPEDPPAQ